MDSWSCFSLLHAPQAAGFCDAFAGYTSSGPALLPLHSFHYGMGPFELVLKAQKWLAHSFRCGLDRWRRRSYETAERAEQDVSLPEPPCSLFMSWARVGCQVGW